MTGQEIARTDDRAVAIMELETRFAMAVRQRELLESYIRERLKPDKHFYKIGDDEKAKPSLTKEGAELICLPHNLKPRYAIVSGPESPTLDDTPFQITVNCELMAGDKFGGQGIGSASSMTTKRDGTRIQRQKDPGLRHNATLKMACKSAYIAATLNSTAASEFFTQDMEDDQGGDEKPPVNGKQGHWCAVHKTAFFMKGKMKSYAHPIGDTGEWCHEHKDDKPATEVKKADASAPAPEIATPPEVKVEQPKIKAEDVAKLPLTGAGLHKALKATIHENVWTPEHAKQRLLDLGAKGADSFEMAKSLTPENLVKLDSEIHEALKGLFP